MPAPSSLPLPSVRPRSAAPGLALVALSALLPMTCSAQLTPMAQREIAGLLHAVGASGCHFMRGGSAYSSAQAQEHLGKKYEYMAARDMLVSTEDFIDKAATRSSMSGEPYAIRCGEAAAQKSDDWMRARLKAMRQAAPR